MLKLTGMMNKHALALDRDSVKGVEAHPAGGTLIWLNTEGKGFHVAESYAKVMRALSMRGRRR